MELLIAIIVLAVIFDFINGFHDSANSIATIVSTRVLTPLQAVVWAAFFNFVAFFIFKDQIFKDSFICFTFFFSFHIIVYTNMNQNMKVLTSIDRIIKKNSIATSRSSKSAPPTILGFSKI